MNPNHVPQTLSGKAVSLDEPLAVSISIDDIASHLSKICRYNGATNCFYSVAEHSVRAASLAAIFGRQAQFAVLMHDAHEAYVGDIVRPLFKAFPPQAQAYITEMKDRLDDAISEAFAFDFSDWKDVVDMADEIMLQIERDYIIDKEVGDWPERSLHLINLSEPVEQSFGWNHDDARTKFLWAFEALRPCFSEQFLDAAE